jgi:hypothetical protein
MAAAAALAVQFSVQFVPGLSLSKFDGTNWVTWNPTFKALMCMNGCTRHLNHSASTDSNDANIQVLWNKQEEVIIGLIFLQVSMEVYSQISSDTVYPTVHDKYQQLESLYGAVGFMATFNLWVGLANTKLQEGSPFLPQLQHMLDVRNMLGENGMAISDMQMSFILLDALPSSYSTIAGTILAQGPPTGLSPQDLVQRFINEESCITGPTSSMALTKAAPIKGKKPFKPKASTSSSSSAPAQGVTCFYCKNDGHKANECHKKKRDLENAKKGKEGQAKKNQMATAPAAKNNIVATTIGSSSASIQEIPEGSNISLYTRQEKPLYLTREGYKNYLDTMRSNIDEMSLDEDTWDGNYSDGYQYLMCAKRTTKGKNINNGEEWMMDSGTSAHFTPYLDDYTTYKTHKGVEIVLGDSSVQRSIGIGSIIVKTDKGFTLELNDVLHVPQMHTHILSTSCLASKEAMVIFDENSCLVCYKGTAIAEGYQAGHLYWLHLKPQPNVSLSSVAESVSLDTWHLHMAHMSKGALSRLPVQEAVKGMHMLSSEKDEGPCHGCELGKSH